MAIVVLDQICKEKEDVRLKLEVGQLYDTICTFPIDALYFPDNNLNFWVFILFFAGMLKESQQWEVYVEGSARCAHAEGPQVSPASSGVGTLRINNI